MPKIKLTSIGAYYKNSGGTIIRLYTIETFKRVFKPSFKDLYSDEYKDMDDFITKRINDGMWFWF